MELSALAIGRPGISTRAALMVASAFSRIPAARYRRFNVASPMLSSDR